MFYVRKRKTPNPRRYGIIRLTRNQKRAHATIVTAAAAGRARAIARGDFRRPIRRLTTVSEPELTRRVRRAEFRDRRWWCAREEVRDTNSDDDLFSLAFSKRTEFKKQISFYG